MIFERNEVHFERDKIQIPLNRNKMKGGSLSYCIIFLMLSATVLSSVKI